MTPEWSSTKLFRWLKSKNDRLAGRVATVRDEQTKWLPYIVSVFPHYPSHGVEHSDRIVAQLSHLLFCADNGESGSVEPVVAFSAAEVYCLICATYLHDMGMVVSPEAQSKILESEAWETFVAEGGKGNKAYAEYKALRSTASSGSVDKNHFLADAALRYLIADFVRRDHHERGMSTLQMHAFLKQLVDDGDSVAFETVAAICAGHGLDDREISDKDRFPEERNVFGEKVNVRFLARLLRIGDLLDMDTRRTDPMSAKAVAPLPPEAQPHWQQYSCKRHENISPGVIEFKYECKDQETHRILRDWLGWLESEVRATALGQLLALRHPGWTPPRCVVGSQASSSDTPSTDQATITIKPAKEATYTFHDWRIEMDHGAVLDLLINRVYEDPLVFVRELIQNALDATRCRMYEDFESQNSQTAPPERPTKFPAEFRERYPLRLSLQDEAVKLTPDGPTEDRPVFTIEDSGIGMDERTITRYFLQVGRSYYKSREFRQRFSFAPTSRFGIGFLSVFAVSSNITVETACRDPESGAQRGTRLVLREPRNYLLTEVWRPFEERKPAARTGTRIRVVVDEWPEKTRLVDLVKEWCVAAEVPVIIMERGVSTEVRSARIIDGTPLAQSSVDPQACFVARTFEVDHRGIEGQIVVIAYQDKMGEGWCECWSDELGLDGERLDSCPQLGDGYQALHGIKVGRASIGNRGYREGSQWLLRLDDRGTANDMPLSRQLSHRDGARSTRTRRIENIPHLGVLAEDAVSSVTQRAVSEHLASAVRATGSFAPYYVRQVLSAAPVSNTWRDEFPGTVVTWNCGRRNDISVTELLSLRSLIVAGWVIPFTIDRSNKPPAKLLPKDVPSTLPVVSYADTPRFCDDRLAEKLLGMNLVKVESMEDMWYLHFSLDESSAEMRRAPDSIFGWVAKIPSPSLVRIHCDFLQSRVGKLCLLDRQCDIVAWLDRMWEAAQSGNAEIGVGEVENLWKVASNSWYGMEDAMERWRRSPRVAAEMKPPNIVRSFYLTFPSIDLRGRRTVVKA